LLRTSSTVALATDAEDKYVKNSAVLPPPKQSMQTKRKHSIANVNDIVSPNNDLAVKSNSNSTTKSKINAPQEVESEKTPISI